MKVQDCHSDQGVEQKAVTNLAPWDALGNEVWNNAVVEVPEEYVEFVERLHCKGHGADCIYIEIEHAPLADDEKSGGY